MTTDTRIDTERLCRRADLLGILGWSDKRQKASTNGGEYAGPCPFCGGTDRFICWPNHPERPACYCRQEARQWDAIGLVQEMHGLDFREACEYLNHHAGIAQVTVTGSMTAPTPPPSSERREAAEQIWLETIPVSGTVGETYLRARAVTIPLPPSIRFAPALWHNPSKTELPALVAALTPADGSTRAAIQRTYLRSDGRSKAVLEPNKMMLGPARGCSVHLAPAGHTLAVTEGTETGLSFMQASGLPTWAAQSTAGIAGLVLPTQPLASTVVIGADRDDNNAGAESAEKAAARWTAEGRTVRIALPPGEHNDWNDALREAAWR